MNFIKQIYTACMNTLNTEILARVYGCVGYASRHINFWQQKILSAMTGLPKVAELSFAEPEIEAEQSKIET